MSKYLKKRKSNKLYLISNSIKCLYLNNFKNFRDKNNFIKYLFILKI